MNKKLLSSEEVMEYLGISRATLTRYVSQRNMPVIRVSKKKNLFDMDAVNQWLAERSEGGGKEG
ncbi:hypothetical protein AM501_28640 [Aneurinibacillus migulanus]|uniref:helix-turn-helix transcriptional regulator n=1 Tax=Aneurinibacillus migulanus TaxID=47500 RepID=UPI0005B886F4|nr:helix-turn-helix domain-containing protein [Aneurinibacillus migulanus]KIV58386.1 hypothetical protein TS64_04850 [Aneurinibacillus migulanus]KPD05015.1 hypothetical protein AM501_28640 [Aneurinibacillus migulanus]